MSLSVWSTHDSLKSLHLIFCSGTPGGIRAAAWAGAPVTQWWRWGWEEVSIRSAQRGMLWQRTVRFFFPFLFQHLKQTQGDDVRKKNWLKITWCRWLIIFAAGLLALMHLLTVLEEKLGMAKHRYTHTHTQQKCYQIIINSPPFFVVPLAFLWILQDTVLYIEISIIKYWSDISIWWKVCPSQTPPSWPSYNEFGGKDVSIKIMNQNFYPYSVYI